MLSIQKILHPTDYSEPSIVAFELACRFACDFSADLIVCHVSPPPVVAVGEGMVVEIPSGEEELMAARLKEVRCDDPRIRVTHQLLRGDPAAEILRQARDEKVDLIVMGTHGRTALARVLLGSVPEKVLRKAPCPVVTVKAPVGDRHHPAGSKKAVVL